MDFAGINYLAVAVAGVAGFIVGGIWYGILANVWMATIGKTKEQLGSTSIPMFVGLIANLAIAFVLAGVIGHLGTDQVTIKNGMISGALIWAGFILTTMATNYGFQKQSVKLVLIDGGHWLAVLLTIGAIIGFYGL